MEPQVLIDALKKSLKLRGITYSQLAEMLDISEATVQRIFSINAFSLERFLKICDLIDLSFQDLAQLEEQTENKIQFYYTKEQEEVLARKIWTWGDGTLVENALLDLNNNYQLGVKTTLSKADCKGLVSKDPYKCDSKDCKGIVDFWLKFWRLNGGGDEDFVRTGNL